MKYQSQSKYDAPDQNAKITTLIKAFYTWVKVFLAPKVRNSVLKELAFVKFGFLTNFTTIFNISINILIINIT